MISLLAFVIIILLIIQDLILNLLLTFNFKSYIQPREERFPKISILIPARNEAHNLPSCLEALDQLRYPKDSLQIILGNDNSEDSTGDILKDWSKKRSNVSYLEIVGAPNNKMNGKANALHQMCEEASGDLYLFTDADCQIGPEWASSMVEAWNKQKPGVVTGITTVFEKGVFARFQALDWWLTLGMVKIMDDLGIAVTSMGNNMLISRSAYNAVGGFAGIPFSLTEDFEIAKQVKKNGFDCIHLVGPKNLILTKGQVSFEDLMAQRKRWMSGAMALPWVWKLLLGLQVFFFPAMLYFVFLFPFEGIFIWLMKVLIQGLFIYRFAFKTGIKLKWHYLLLFEIYYALISWSTIVYYFWPSKTKWKGRKY